MSVIENSIALLGWEYKIRKTELLVKVCPFCGNTKFNFQINTEKGIFHSWCCNKGGTYNSLAKTFGLAKVRRQVKVEEVKPSAESLKAVEDFYKFDELIKLDGSRRKIVEDYLLSRGLTYEEGLRLKFRYVDQKTMIDERLKKLYNNRVVIPLFDLSDNLVFFVGRAVNKNPLKYLNCKVERREILPVFKGLINPSVVVLVEGVFDAIAVNRAGFSSLPLLSMDISRQQTERLGRIGFYEVVIALDSGEDANSIKIQEKLSIAGIPSRVWFRYDGKDLDELAQTDLKNELNDLLSKNFDSQKTQEYLTKVNGFISRKRGFR